ncbi:MAG: winged helix-turn-helix domain-containing protein [Pyrinomonadaceae bacterium]
MKDIREFGNFRLDAAQNLLFFLDSPIDLPLREIDLLCALTERPGEVVSKQELMEKVWKDAFVEESNISRHVYLLRKLFADLGVERELIQTVPRRGYRFTGEVYVNSSDLVIERHLVEETIIEEIPVAEGRSARRLPRSKNQLAFVGLVAILLAVGVVGFSVWRNGSAFSSSKLSDLRSIAVLPLKSFSTAQTDEDMSLRITDALITKIASRTTDLSVRPTRAILPFASSVADPVSVGKDLEVDAVVDGRVQQEGDRLRITLQLLSVKTGEQLWSQQFDGMANGILDLQDAISSQLLVKLERLGKTGNTKRPTASDEAYEHYLRGRFSWNKRTRQSLQNAIAEFEQSIKDDDEFAEAFVGLADSYYLLYDYGYDTSTKNVDAARENVRRAIELNPDLADAHAILGLISTSFDWNWKEAENELRKAKDLDPNSANAHHRLGVLLTKQRRFSEAEVEMRRAKELDPTSPAIITNLAQVFMGSHRFDEAIDQFQKALSLDPNFSPAIWYLGRCYWSKGEIQEYVQYSARALETEGDRDLAKRLRQTSDAMGDVATLKMLAMGWEKSLGKGVNEHDIAILYAILGDRTATLDWLERLVSTHHPWATWINAEPEFDGVRDELRFRALLKKMNLDT